MLNERYAVSVIGLLPPNSGIKAVREGVTSRWWYEACGAAAVRTQRICEVLQAEGLIPEDG